LEYIEDDMAVPFALTPAIAIPGVIDFTTREGQRLYKDASYKMDDELYDCQAGGLYQFLATLHIRSQEFGWNHPVNGIMLIPDIPNDPNSPTKYLIDNCGQIPLETIREFETTYLQIGCRPAQDTIMLFKCLMASISKEAKNKILIWRDQYTVNGFSSGNLLLKIIIRESHLDTNATTSVWRNYLFGPD
jgi:hypothetical protein